MHTLKHCPDQLNDFLDWMNWLVLYTVNLVLSQAPPPFIDCDLPGMERQHCEREFFKNSLLHYKIIGNASEFTTYHGEK